MLQVGDPMHPFGRIKVRLYNELQNSSLVIHSRLSEVNSAQVDIQSWAVLLIHAVDGGISSTVWRTLLTADLSRRWLCCPHVELLSTLSAKEKATLRKKIL